jgi:hypothetical protein
MTAHHMPEHDTPADSGIGRDERRETDQVVAVVGDTATAAQAHRYATLIQDLAGVPSRVILVDNPDPSPPAQGQLPPDTGVVVLTGTHAAPLGDAAGRSPMLAEQDVAAIVAEAVLTDTLLIPGRARFPQLTVLSIAPLLANAVRQVFNEGSVTSLFDGADSHRGRRVLEPVRPDRP